MEARVVLRAAAALDLGAKEYPSSDRNKSNDNDESDELATAQTTDELRAAALFGWGSSWEALRRRLWRRLLRRR
jgi:hypothetical protein